MSFVNQNFSAYILCIFKNVIVTFYQIKTNNFAITRLSSAKISKFWVPTSFGNFKLKYQKNLNQIRISKNALSKSVVESQNETDPRNANSWSVKIENCTFPHTVHYRVFNTERYFMNRIVWPVGMLSQGQRVQRWNRFLLHSIYWFVNLGTKRKSMKYCSMQQAGKARRHWNMYTHIIYFKEIVSWDFRDNFF